jgi:hypothetical protein
MQRKCYYCRISIKIEFPWQTFEKYANIKFHENSSGGSRVLPCGKPDKQTDRETWKQIYDETNSHFTQFSTSPIRYRIFVYRRQQYFKVWSQSMWWKRLRQLQCWIRNEKSMDSTVCVVTVLLVWRTVWKRHYGGDALSLKTYVAFLTENPNWDPPSRLCVSYEVGRRRRRVVILDCWQSQFCPLGGQDFEPWDFSYCHRLHRNSGRNRQGVLEHPII